MQHHSFICSFVSVTNKLKTQSMRLFLSKWIFDCSAGEQVEMSSERSSSHPFVGLAFKLEVS